MKVWKKVKINNQDRRIDAIASSLANYIFKDSSLEQLFFKYRITEEEMKQFKTYTTSRIAGLLLLYLSKDTNRINDIVNKYQLYEIDKTMPEVEGYVSK